MLESIALRARSRGDVWDVEVRLSAPARVLDHVPTGPGRTLRIQLERVGGGDRGEPSELQTERWPLSPEDRVLVAGIELDRQPGRRMLLELRFRRELEFRVVQGESLYQLRIEMRQPAPPRADGLTPAPEAAASGPARWIEQGREAMEAGEYERAVLLFTKAISHAEPAQAAAAQEQLGVAYQRSGRRAHAVAEYENYLARYPDGEAAERVRQRLAALRSADEEPPSDLRPARGEPERSVVDLAGSLSTTYVYSEAVPDDGDSVTTASIQLTDLFAVARIDTRFATLRPRVSASHRYDYDAGDKTLDSRLSELLLDAESLDGRYRGVVGRQSRVGGGVLGRFDGVRTSARLGDRWSASFTAGFPLDSQGDDTPDFDRRVVGGSIGLEPGLPGLDVEVWGVGQWVDDFVDRAAIGADVYYGDERMTLLASLDVDVYFGSLNSILGTGSWRLTEEIDLRFLAEQGNSPFITREAALSGQSESSLDSLSNRLSNSEIDDLAEDRTPDQTILSVGASYRPWARTTLSGDLDFSRLGGTPTSGGVPGTESTGWEYGPRFQWVQEDVLVDGDVGSLVFGVFHGDRFDRYSLLGSARFPFGSMWRLRPRIGVDVREGDGSDEVRIAASSEVELRWRFFIFELELGGSRLERSDDGEWSYYSEASVRVEF